MPSPPQVATSSTPLVGEAARRGGELARRARGHDLAGAVGDAAQAIAEAGRAPHAERVRVEDDGELHGIVEVAARDPLARLEARAFGRRSGRRRAAPKISRASARRPRRKSAAPRIRTASRTKRPSGSVPAQRAPELVGGVGEAAAPVELAAEEVVDERVVGVRVGELLQRHEIERGVARAGRRGEDLQAACVRASRRPAERDTSRLTVARRAVASSSGSVATRVVVGVGAAQDAPRRRRA